MSAIPNDPDLRDMGRLAVLTRHASEVLGIKLLCGSTLRSLAGSLSANGIGLKDCSALVGKNDVSVAPGLGVKVEWRASEFEAEP